MYRGITLRGTLDTENNDVLRHVTVHRGALAKFLMNLQSIQRHH